MIKHLEYLGSRYKHIVYLQVCLVRKIRSHINAVRNHMSILHLSYKSGEEHYIIFLI